MSLNHRSPDGVELRAIPGFPDYFAGDDGEVYSCRIGRKLRRVTGGYFTAKTGVRYRTHQVTAADGRRKNVCRHFLIALAWLGPRPAGKVTDHANGNSEDNRPANLRYCTYRENTNNPNSRPNAGMLRRAENLANQRPGAGL